MRHALLGGTFDPIHKGHIHAAEKLAQTCQLDHITLLPSAQPPHKRDKILTPFLHRFTMAQHAVATNDLFSVSDFENTKGGLSYSIDSVNYFRKCHPDDTLFFIMGNDMAGIFSTWKSWEAILERIELLVVQRPNEEREIDPRLPQEIQAQFQTYYREIETLPISSTLVRSYILSKSYDDAAALLDPLVLAYIKEQCLYL